MQFMDIYPIIIVAFYLAGAALVIYIVMLVVQILRLTVQALKKYLQS